jgi:hypothetical protein
MNGIAIFCLCCMLGFAVVLSMYAYRGAKGDVQQALIVMCGLMMFVMTVAGFARGYMDMKASIYGDDFMRIDSARHDSLLAEWKAYIRSKGN